MAKAPVLMSSSEGTGLSAQIGKYKLSWVIIPSVCAALTHVG